ncbi:MAG: DUF885 family protein, partial [Pyrinomonadaceae bacterium]
MTALVGCQQNAVQQQNQNAGARSAPEWDGFVDQYLNDYFTARPDAAVYAGRHEFDGKLPDWSPDGLKKEIQRLRSARERAMAFKDETLDERQRFERDYLVAQVDKELFWIETAEWPYRNPIYYSDAIDPDVYVSREYAPLDVRLKAYTAYAQAVPKALDQIRANLRLPLARPFIRIGRTTIGGLAAFYSKDVPTVFASVMDEKLQSDFRAANDVAIKAVKDFDAWLDSQNASGTNDFAIGADKFQKMLMAGERVEIPLDKLEEIGRKDMDRNLKALSDACAKYAPGMTVQQCVDKSQAIKPEGSVVETATRQLGELKAFINSKGIVTIPGSEEAKVAEAPAYK